jgi:hypothetical protein
MLRLTPEPPSLALTGPRGRAQRGNKCPEARKTYGIRLAVAGGGQVMAELVSVGQSGEQSLKRIESAGERASGGRVVRRSYTPNHGVAPAWWFSAPQRKECSRRVSFPPPIPIERTTLRLPSAALKPTKCAVSSLSLLTSAMRRELKIALWWPAFSAAVDSARTIRASNCACRSTR